MSAEASPPDPTPQDIVDALSVAVARPVLLDDPQLTPLAHSPQWEVDEVRRRSILSRGPSDAVRGALFAQGIERAGDVVHTSSDPELEMEGRVCMPVRWRGKVVGYLWLLDPRQDLGEEQLGQVRRAAREIAPLLGASGRRQIDDERELLEALRSSSQERRQRAAAELRDRHLLAGEEVVLLLVAATAAEADPLAAVRQAARRLSVGQAIAATVEEGAALLVSPGDPVLRPLAESDVALWLLRISGPGLAVGQSSPADPSMLDAASHQAALALRVARSRAAGAAATWSSLGADRLIAQLPASARRDLPGPLLRLIDDEPGLAMTLAAFLDAAGDVKATAAALSLHRSGLYYRLRRIEEITGLDLGDGDDRLLAHIALRTAQMFS